MIVTPPAPRTWRDKITTNFVVDEFAVSSSHPTLVSAVPRPLLPNILALCQWVLEPVRIIFGGPLRITSGYRSAALNNAVGSTESSQHRTASAADTQCGDIVALWKVVLDLTRQDAIPGMGQVIYYPARRFIHFALRGNRYPFPHTCLHEPARGVHYAHVKPTWEDTIALLRYEPKS